MNKIEIKWAAVEHAAGILHIYQNIVQHTPISFELEIPNEKEIQRRIESVSQNYPWIVAIQNEKVVGYAYATSFRARAAYRFTLESTVYVHEDHRKKGIAKKLYDQLLEMLNFQGVQQVMAVITLPNEPSEKFHAKLGFEPVGVTRKAGYKFNEYWDIAFMQKDLQQAVTKELKPMEELRTQFTF